MTKDLSVNKNHTGEGLKRYYWLAFVIGGMVVGFLGCLIYAHQRKSLHSLLSDDAGNPKTDKPIVQTAITVEEPSQPPAFLGVEIISVTAVIAKQFGLENPGGVLVNSVIDNSPAQKVGLQRSDVILSLNNTAVEDVNGFRDIITRLNPGNDVRIIYVREGKKDIAYATLADSTTAMAKALETNDSGWGASLSKLSSDLRSSLRIPAGVNGIVILSITPGGAADEAGLLSGDVITAVNNTPISDMSDFFDALTADEDGTVLLDIYSKGNLRYVALDSTGVVESVAQTQTSLVERIFSVFFDNDNVILTEHINEEDDYEKPVCKRLEESGERYEK